MRKGISLVALVITIIVLIILTAAVFLTGGDTPSTAKKAVFMSDASTLQDAVTLYRLNYMAENNGVVPAMNEATPTNSVTVGGTTYADFATAMTASELNISGIDLALWRVSTDGVVILATGVTDGADTYYNSGLKVSGAESGAVSFTAYAQ